MTSTLLGILKWNSERSQKKIEVVENEIGRINEIWWICVKIRSSVKTRATPQVANVKEKTIQTKLLQTEQYRWATIFSIGQDALLGESRNIVAARLR